MMREVAIRQLQSLRDHCRSMVRDEYEDDIWAQDIEALDIALSALRPVSRERVEKVWMGEWEFPIFKDGDANDPRCKCSECGSVETPLARHRFCPSCGAPMTDEAVEMAMERLEALYERNDD